MSSTDNPDPCVEDTNRLDFLEKYSFFCPPKGKTWREAIDNSMKRAEREAKKEEEFPLDLPGAKVKK